MSADLVRTAGYRGAGTVEYLYQPDQKVFTFLEVNTRLQVEHPITEVTTGIDLVKLQIFVASGGTLDGECPGEFGHAVEARLNAEDADNDFAPAPGTVRLLKFPLGSGLRVDTGIAQGDVIPPDYDSMVAKIIAWGRDRSEALARLRTALRETTVVIDGGTTNKSFLLDLLDRDEVISASADTGWLDRSGAGTPTGPTPTADIALIAAAVDAYEAEESLERAGFLASARGGRPRASHAIGRKVELNYQGQSYGLTVGQIGPRGFRIVGDCGDLVVEVERLSEYESRLILGHHRFQVVTVAGPTGFLVEVDGTSHRISQDEAGLVRAASPAVVVAMPVAVGDEVEAGATLVVLESMKMETALRAPAAGRVREVYAVVNSQVDAGAALLRFDQAGESAATEAVPRVQFRAEPRSDDADVRAEARAALDELRSLITGYDVSGERARALLAKYDGLRQRLPRDDQELVEAEIGLLDTFADICELSRNRPTLDEESSDESVHSPREYFHSFLHSLDAEVEGLPEAFQAKITRALRNYDVTSLEPGPELEEAVYRLFLALQRMENHVPVISGLLGRWLSADDVPTASTSAVGEVLDRLIAATQVRYPVIGDIARNLRFRLFDEPQIAKAREQIYDGVRDGLQYLADHPDAPDYAARINELLDTPELLIDLLAERISSPGALLEVITRRYYEIRALEDVKTFDKAGGQFVTGSYELAGEQLHLVSTVTDRARLSTTLDTIDEIAGPKADNLVVDIYLSWPDAPTDGDEVSAALADVLAAHPSTSSWRRVTMTVVGANLNQMTFRPAPDGGLAEDPTIRDMHPLTGQRLDLWRMKNFDGTRLPAAAGTYLFHVVAKDNPSDERLMALAEVRDVTPQRNESGEVIGVPALERALAACLDGIRRTQAQRGKKRLDANRVALYVWPVLDIPNDRLPAITRRLAPLAVNAGLEEITILASIKDDADVAAQTGGDSLLVQPGRRHRRECDGAADRAVAPARRVRAEGATLTSPRLGVPVRADPDSHGPRRQLRRIRPRRVRRARPGGPALWAQHRRPDRRRGDAAHGPLPRGHDPRRLVRRPDESPGHGGRSRMRPRGRGARSRREAVGAGRVVRLVLRRHHFDAEWHREHGLGVPRASPDHHVHPERRRDQRHRRGNQRWRATVLERRSDDADAHQGHSGDDAGQRDGAHRQAIARLLRWRFGGGQLRHRRLRPRDGTQRSSPVLGAEPPGRV